MGGFPSPATTYEKPRRSDAVPDNLALLIELWPHLHLDVRIIAAWENTFDSLHGKNEWGRIHTAPTHSEE